jgi:hypothetical protein
VESVSISVSGDNVTLKDADNIADAVAIQRSVVANKAVNAGNGQDTNTFRITYYLKNGRCLLRLYSVKMTEALAADPNSDMSKLQALLNTREAIESRKATNVAVTRENITNADISYYDAERGSYEDFSLTSAQAEELYSQAIVPDVDSGALGRIWLMTSGSDYYSKVYALTLYIDLRDASVLPAGGNRAYDENCYGYFHTTLTVDATNTLKWLADNTDIVPVMEKEADEAMQDSKKRVVAEGAVVPAVTPIPAAAAG